MSRDQQPKRYRCEICKSKYSQLSHNKSHLKTGKHKDKKELFKLKLLQLTEDKLFTKYKTKNIDKIIKDHETKIENEIDINITMNNITNKEALRDKIHELHNFLRNNGAGYGMNALKVFNILYGLKKIEENKLFDKLDLINECKFEFLLNLANEDKGEELAALIFGKVLGSLYDSKLKGFLFYEIPRNMKGNIFVHLIKEINQLTIIEKSCGVQLSGKIYEYFIGRDESAISELGAYFTDRHIVNYIFKQLEPKINKDGHVSIMIDPYGGSGGFTTGYINYLKKHDDNINWKNELKKIHHYDMNEDVIKSAALEFFCITGELPDMKTLQYKNSFKDEFSKLKFKYVITNPPYGGDKNKKSDAQNKREKVKKYILNDLLPNLENKISKNEEIIQKRETNNQDNSAYNRKKEKYNKQKKSRNEQLKKFKLEENIEKKKNNDAKVTIKNSSNRIQQFAKLHKLTGNDKEICSLILMMDLLDKDGTGIGVLKEGVFFSKTYASLRECLIKNFNVRKVISIPQDQFENTSTKTSIVIFNNTEEKTSQIEFYELIVDKFTEDKFEEMNGDIILVENKDDIRSVHDKLISTATLNDLKENGIWSLNSKRYNKKTIIPTDEYRLIKLKDVCTIFCGKSLTKKQAINGKYKVYGGGKSSYTHNNYNREGFNIIISRVGNNNITLVDEKYYLTDNGFSLDLFDKYKKFVKYICYYIICNQEEIKNIKNGSAQKVISKTNLYNFEILIPKSEKKINEWIKKLSTSKNQRENEIKKLEENLKTKINELSKTSNMIPLNKLVKFISGKKRTTSESVDDGKYPLFSSSLEVQNYLNTFDYDKTTLIINTINCHGKCNIHISDKFNLTSNTIAFQSNNIDSNYLYYILNIMKKDIEKLYDGSGKKKLNKSDLMIFKIPIPKDNQVIKDLEPMFQEIETLHNDVKNAENLFQQYIKDLRNEAIKEIK